jgi:DNA-binding response OmpR family regulator
MVTAMRKTLLIADSDRGTRDRHLGFLVAAGYDVATASDAADCLRKIYDVQPVALVLDHDLRWSGYAGVLTRLRDDKHTLPIIVILTVTTEDSQRLTESIGIPIAACVPKAIPSASLAELLASTLKRRVQDDSFASHSLPVYSDAYDTRSSRQPENNTGT